MDSISGIASGWLAVITGATGIGALVTAVLAFVFGRTFGRVGDVLVTITTLLTAGLAMLLYPEFRAFDAQLASIAFGLALVGASTAAFGSLLAATGATTWFLAQLYVSCGFSLVGFWLLIMNASARSLNSFPNRAINIGILAGAVMVLGVAAIPGALARSASEHSAPWISRYIGRAGYLGWLVLYPLWCIWLGISRI